MSQSKFAYVLFCILIGLEVTKVEICALRHVAVELESGKVTVSVCVSAVFPGNRSKDFAGTWSEVKRG